MALTERGGMNIESRKEGEGTVSGMEKRKRKAHSVAREV